LIVSEDRRSAHDAPTRALVVVVTGSESTGKTTLASDLARHYGTTWVPEFARAYADEQEATTGRELDASDVEPIARGHIAWADAALGRARGLVVLDQDLVSTVVYARHYYGSCPEWIERAAWERRGDLYLLCGIDAPWVRDQRRDRPHHRDELHASFIEALDALGARYVVIRGSWEARLATAISAIDNLRDELGSES
jgi:NadR type nicotinamide-nucleotide adenylyltransferase